MNPRFLPDFADRLNRLVDATPVACTHSRRHSNQTLARALHRIGMPVDHSRLYRLRTTSNTTPGADLVGALSELFEVPVTYFYETQIARETDQELTERARRADRDLAAI